MNRHRTLLLGLVLCLLPVTSRAADTVADNLVKNGDFATDTDGWSLRVQQKAEVSATLARNENGEASVLVINGGGSKAAVMLQQLLASPLVKDAVYVVEFDVRADAPKSFDAIFRSAENTILGGAYNLPSDPAVTHHKFTYSHTLADAAGVKLTFRIGGNNIPVSFDNITVTRQPSAP
jgi:hypothetical protein